VLHVSSLSFFLRFLRVFAAICLLLTMRALILVAMFAAARLWAASASPSDSPSSLPDGLYAKITTPRGTIIARLFYEDAPMTVTNFVGLAEGTLGPNPGKPFYDGLTFHRVVPGFVIQGGDPLGTGNGDPGYEFPDEFSPKLRHDSIGVLSMANSGPDTNGCQFFITLDAENQLNYLHSVFGKVVSGLDVLPLVQKGDKMEVKILRLGSAAKGFQANQTSFNALTEKAPHAAFPHFSDEDGILPPATPPREKGFNNKLFNFERFTGVKFYARVFEAFEPTGPGQSRTDLAKAVARQLGVERTGITALYFADAADWEFVMGEELLRKIGKAGDQESLEWEKSLQSQAKETSEKWIASAGQRADKPVTDAQKSYMRIATMLEEIVQAFSPKATP
jgi:cyclophilin family peptidyl-prolyl cis-trans isomerase